MNPHLNAFYPYNRHEVAYEDDLTRAAMVLIRLVPDLHDALLQRVAAVGLADLPPGEIDIQTGRLESEENGSRDAERLVSVWLTPDFGPADRTPTPTEGQEGRRVFDAVLRHEPALIVVIESKIVEGADDWQSRAVRRGGERRKLQWHELLDEWWKVIDADRLDATALQLVGDFFAFTEAHYPQVVPYTTLRRAGENEPARRSRLCVVLQEATGLAVEPRTPRVQVDAAGVGSFKLIALEAADGGPTLYAWPAWSNEQAKRIFGDPGRVESLLDLVARDERWEIKPVPHVGFWNSDYRTYWEGQWEHSAEQYLRQWREDLDWVGGYRPDKARQDLWPWLVERGYAKEAPDQRDDFEEVLARGMPQYLLRPGFELRYRWSWEEALRLDDKNDGLVPHVRAVIRQLLHALGEDPLEVTAAG